MVRSAYFDCIVECLFGQARLKINGIAAILFRYFALYEHFIHCLITGHPILIMHHDINCRR
jgi:hypothetical protein